MKAEGVTGRGDKPRPLEQLRQAEPIEDVLSVNFLPAGRRYPDVIWEIDDLLYRFIEEAAGNISLGAQDFEAELQPQDEVHSTGGDGEVVAKIFACKARDLAHLTIFTSIS